MSVRIDRIKDCADAEARYDLLRSEEEKLLVRVRAAEQLFRDAWERLTKAEQDAYNEASR